MPKPPKGETHWLSVYNGKHELRYIITDVLKYAENALRAALGNDADAYMERRGSKWHIDLKGINAHWLRSVGVRHIDICDHCTGCRPDLYWSHRKMGNSRGAQVAMIALQGGEGCL